MAQYLTQVQSRCDGCAETAYLVGTPYGLWCSRCWRLWIRAEPLSRAFPIEFGRQARESALARQAVLARRAALQIEASHARQVALDRVRARVSSNLQEEPEPEPEPKRRRLD